MEKGDETIALRSRGSMRMTVVFAIVYLQFGPQYCWINPPFCRKSRVGLRGLEGQQLRITEDSQPILWYSPDSCLPAASGNPIRRKHWLLDKLHNGNGHSPVMRRLAATAKYTMHHGHRLPIVPSQVGGCCGGVAETSLTK